MTMIASRQYLHALVLAFLAICLNGVIAENLETDATINNLYENLLQREYAGPVVFPNHVVERKAQRSPSLRLRFGRSDPSLLMPEVQKRWFGGDVNKKPIRSPSLRLRFGRRSDPSMPLEHDFDDVYEDDNNDYENHRGPLMFVRPIRNPRLRWGRSLPFEGAEDNYIFGDDELQKIRDDELLNSFISSEKVRNLLHALQEMNENQDESVEFNREVRKPGPLRLRWGRSTGGAPVQKITQDQSKLHPEATVTNQIVDVPATDKA